MGGSKIKSGRTLSGKKSHRATILPTGKSEKKLVSGSRTLKKCPTLVEVADIKRLEWRQGFKYQKNRPPGQLPNIFPEKQPVNIKTGDPFR
ncbi:hypothetical protein LFE_1963 [Leptospirillum ferrooxidans C2-3]|uniref:Uncharacterized protein n=1 Tax=Leptospirillum ferrooxidans (strain C2-3) TaxID=1162668 RepID=I0IQU1_LEPFC|nr:hypothetical protein LFE_1963 [Leptospirillum ferrooxidans C2-3]